MIFFDKLRILKLISIQPGNISAISLEVLPVWTAFSLVLDQNTGFQDFLNATL